MTTDNRFDASRMYDIHACKIQFVDKVIGGMPKNPDLLKGWIAATTEKDDGKTTAQEAEARAALLEPTEEKSWTTFPGDATGIFLWSRQIKALFKEAATMLRVTEKARGSKQIFQHGFEIKGDPLGDRVYLRSETNTIFSGPEAYIEGPIHVQTPQGPRTAITRNDYVSRATLEFHIWILATAAAETRHISETVLGDMLCFGQENGLGASRSQGYGKFTVLDFEQIQKSTWRIAKEKDAKAA